MIFINLATPKATAEHDLLLNLIVIKVKATSEVSLLKKVTLNLRCDRIDKNSPTKCDQNFG